MTRARISDHFTVEEFDCHNGQRVPGYALGALRVWAAQWGEPMRERFGPVTIMSGFRPEPYNGRVGGAKGSYHVYDALLPGGTYRGVLAVAADVTCAKGTPRAWAAWAMARQASITAPGRGNDGGVGRYPTFVHLDTGPRRTWAG